MKVQANSIEELLAESGPYEADMRALDQLIVETAPELKRQLFAGPSITMIGYGEMDWESKSSSGVWPLISVAPQKTGIKHLHGGREGRRAAAANLRPRAAGPRQQRQELHSL